MAWIGTVTCRMRLTRSVIFICLSVLLSALLLVLLPVAALAGDNVWTSTGPPSNNVRALTVDPSNPQTIYAGTSGGVYKSTNGGDSWAAANTGMGSVQVYALAIDPSNPRTIYAGTSLGLFKSTNGGNSWTGIYRNIYSSESALIRALAVDPWNPQVIYVGTNWGGGVFKSTDGGNSWTTTNINSNHAWALAIDPSNPLTVYVGTFDGAYKSINGGSSSKAINFYTYFGFRWCPCKGWYRIWTL